MNNIIKLLLLSSVEGNKTSPPENNLTQTKLSCEQLEGSERNTCSGLSSKDQTEFLTKLRDQIDSLSEGSAKGHIKTVVSIDSYVVDEASCTDKSDTKTKKATKKVEQVDEGDQTAEGDSDAGDDEEIKAAKREAEKAKKLAAEAAEKEAESLAYAAEQERLAKAKAAKAAAQAAHQAKLDEEKAKKVAKQEADDARRRAAEADAEAKRKAQAEADAILKRELEAEAAAAKKQAEEEAAAKELEQIKIAKAIRKAKEEEALAKKEAELEAAAAKKKAEEEAAAAEAEEAKRKEQEALQALEAARKAKLAADAKNGNQVNNSNKNGSKNSKNASNSTKEFIKKDKLKNSTTKAAIADDEDENSTKQKEADEEEQEMKKAKKAVSAQPKTVKVATGDDEEEDAKAAEEAAKKALQDAEEEAAEKAEKARKKANKETKLEKKAEAAEEAAEKAEADAAKKKAKAAADNDKTESEEAEEAEALAKEKRLQAEAAQRKAAKAAAAAKKAIDDSATCKLKEANEAKTEDAADQALKDAEKARKQAKNATKKAKEIRDKKEAEGVEGEKKGKEEDKAAPQNDQASSSEDEEEKKRKEAEAAQAKADAEAMAIRLHKEKVRKELAAAEEAAKLVAEKQAREAAEKARREAAELERKAQEAAEKARVKQEAEKRKAEEEAARLEKQKAIEAEEKRKAKIAAEAEARRAEAEAKEKEQRAIRLAKEEERKAAEEAAAKEAAIRAARVAFFDKLPSEIIKGSDKRFTNNEQFSIIQYSNQKVNLMRGKYTFKARTYQDAFERFADLIKPVVMQNPNAEFGLVGNKKLLLTTSLFNDNIKDKKAMVAGEEYKSDKISMMMLGLGLREDIIGWEQDMMLEGKEYMMISYSETEKNATIKLMGENYAQAKTDFDAAIKKNGTVGILIDWNHQFKHWSADYNLALQALSHYCFGKGLYKGIVFDEIAAGFLMEWQTQEKIDAKIKSITGQFSGDGSVFATQQYFYIWKWSAGRVSFVQRGSFWKMGDAYSWYIQYVTEYLKRDWGADLLLVGSNTPMLSTAEWNSDINKLMIGKSIAEGTISLKSFYEGQAQQYYMLLMNKATSALKIEALGANSNKAYQSFGTKTAGGSAVYWGILFNSNGKIYKIVGDNSNKIFTGDYWGYWVMTEYIQTSMQRWTTYVHNEQECHITLKKEEDARKLEQDTWKKEFATRIMRYGEDLIDNFNGTGYRFAKNEKFIGIRYNTMKNEINYWSFFQNNMDRAYETFGKQIKMWATRNFQDTRHDPEEYFLFGNNRLLLSSLSTISQEENGMNITNVVIGWAYDKQLYTPDDGLLDPDGYKQHWTLLQDRKTNKTTMAKCEEDLNRCSLKFEKATEYFQDEPKKGSRGVLLRGPKDSIKKFSVNEGITYNSTSWNFKQSLYSLVGEFMAANNDGDFDSYYVPDESSAGFEIKAPYYKNKRLFHSMVNMKQANNRYFQVHGWWNTYYLKGPVTYYGDPAKWWKDSYGNLEVEKKDMVQILMADVDKYSSKPVMVYKPGQMLNDTRMFINFGELARVKGYAPNNCSFKVGKGENIKMVHQDLKTNQIVFSDTKTTNWEDAKVIAADTWKESTGEIWLVYTDQKVYNIYKDNQNPLGELAVLGQWIFESCPDYQHMHPTDVELGFPTIYEH